MAVQSLTGSDSAAGYPRRKCGGRGQMGAVVSRAASQRRAAPPRAREAMASLAACELCPHACKVNRLEGKHGVCRMGGERGDRLLERPPVGRAADLRDARLGHDLLLRLHRALPLLPELLDQPDGLRQPGHDRTLCGHDARAAAPRGPQHQLRHADAFCRRTSLPQSTSQRAGACASRSSTTPAATNGSRRSACSTA